MLERLYAFASKRHYWRHLAPIVAKLRERGHDVEVLAERAGQQWGAPLSNRYSIDLVLVAAAVDAQRFVHRERVVYVEHGAGQTYTVDDDRLRFGWAGGPGLSNVRLFLCPSERVARAWLSRYPATPAEVIGSAVLDAYAPGDGASVPVYGPHAPASRRVVAITCHWNCGGYDALPEAMPALPYFEVALPHLRIDLARAGIELVGHAHPRIARQMERKWAELGIAYEHDPDVLLRSSSLVIADNTSLLYEAAAAGTPVLCLNAPWYRRDVEHGLRFWSHVPGLQVDEPRWLSYAVHEALGDPPEARALRARAAAYAYAAVDGRAADRAVDAILTLEGVPMPDAPLNMHQLREVIERLYALGATEALVADVEGQWAEWSQDERDRWRKMNDVRLRAEIVQAQDVPRVAEIPSEFLLPSEAEIDEAAGEMLVEPEDAIVEAVGNDAELAARLFRLESEAADRFPRPGLLEALAAVAGVEYDPEVEEPAEPDDDALAAVADEPEGDDEPEDDPLVEEEARGGLEPGESVDFADHASPEALSAAVDEAETV